MSKLSVIVPVFNEINTIERLLRAVRSCGLANIEIVLVDDFSTDGTRELLTGELGGLIDTLALHEKNQGKGAALRTGISKASGDYAIFQDADLEYDPREYGKMLEVLDRGDADVVYGSRFLDPLAREESPFWHYGGNALLTMYSNFHTGLKLTDMETCYKMIPLPLLQSLVLKENKFGVEPEITAKLAASGARIAEVSISYDRRSFEEGKKIGAKDGFRAMYVITKYGIKYL